MCTCLVLTSIHFLVLLCNIYMPAVQGVQELGPLANFFSCALLTCLEGNYSGRGSINFFLSSHTLIFQILVDIKMARLQLEFAVGPERLPLETLAGDGSTATDDQ